MNRYNLILWDFNGTILDDIQTGIDSVNVLLKDKNLQTIDSLTYYQERFCFPIKTYYERLGFDFTQYPYDELAHEWVREYVSREKTIPLQPGIKETLEAIRTLQIPQVILSSCEKTMMLRQLNYFGLVPYFQEILGLDNVYAGGKIGLAREWMKNKEYKALMIGDTSHDFLTAQAIGADCILFYSGNESVSDLSRNGVPVIREIPELLNYL